MSVLRDGWFRVCTSGAATLAAFAFGCSSDETASSNDPRDAASDAREDATADPDTGPGDATADGADATDARTDEAAPDGTNDGFVPLFNGRDLTGFELAGIDASSVSVEDGIIEFTGFPNGYLYTTASYRNFVLRVDLRYVPPPAPDPSYNPNSGIFVYVTEPYEIWPRALEVQGLQGDMGDVFALPPPLDPLQDNLDRAALEIARRPIGEWNQFEITSNEGALDVRLNGTLINHCPATTELREGNIALESEAAPVEFRNILLKPLP